MKNLTYLLIISILHFKIYAQDELGSILDAVEFKRTSAPVDVTSGMNGESNAGTLKVAFIDMNKLFTSFNETKAAEEQLNSARSAAKSELDVKLERLQKMMDEINSLNSRGKFDERDGIVQEARSLDKQITEFRSKREKVLQDQFVKMRTEIIEKLNVIVRQVAEENNVNVIYDRSGISMGQIPVVVYTKGVFDITETCIEKANSR